MTETPILLELTAWTGGLSVEGRLEWKDSKALMHVHIYLRATSRSGKESLLRAVQVGHDWCLVQANMTEYE